MLSEDYKHYTLSVIIPIFNEAKYLESVIKNLMVSSCPIKREWIFIDDCSTDDSLLILKKLASQYDYKVIELKKNSGKGTAVIRGFKEASGDFIMIQDADFEYDPGDVPTLLAPLLENKADVIYGSRFKKNGFQVHRTYHYFVNRFLTITSNLLSGIYLTDMETCYKIFRTDIIKAMNLKSKRFGIEVELTAYIAKIHVRIFEMPISYFPRTQLQGKKINWKDGLAAVVHLIRFNVFTATAEAFHLVPKNYQTNNCFERE